MAVVKPVYDAYSTTYWDGVCGVDIKSKCKTYISLYNCNFQEISKSFMNFIRTV